ncbi:MAG: aminoacyl-tRNA hydrolase [Candidatus Omnitrophica bacterium]|nr:aminoacyl-tRNA hydrolase [Candidatus Omnitrophota bacterium]
MKLIVGLGNPGRLYQETRHNIGRLVVRELAKTYQAIFKKDSGTFSFTTKIKIDHANVILAAPFTFMNLSGVAVDALIKKYKIDLADLLVVHDDLDLEFSRIKIQGSGSSAGHKGIKSIIYSLGKQDFSRLRIGISKPQDKKDTRDYVLAGFNKEEKAMVNLIVQRAIQCCEIWAKEGLTKAMNTFNQWEKTR